MATKKTKTTTVTKSQGERHEPPESLSGHIFYGLTLNKEQAELRDAIWDRNTDIVLCNAKPGSGKAQPDDTLIPTPIGRRKLGELEVGDYVFDRYGNPTKILGVYRQGKQHAYEVVFNDGRRTICAKEHLWTYYGNSGQFVTETLDSMLNRSMGKTKKNGGRRISRYSLPINQAVKYSAQEYSIDPYVIGVLIGDGSCTCNQLMVSSNDEPVVAEVARLIGAKEYVKTSSKNYNWIFVMNDDDANLVNAIHNSNPPRKYWFSEDFLKDVPELMCKSYEKHIPSQYLYGSVEQRMSLLQGIFDTDGSVQYSGGRYNVTYTSTSKRLIEDIVELVRGLGFACTVSIDNRVDKYTSGVCYSIYVRVANEYKPLFFRKSPKLKLAQDSLKLMKSRHYDRLAITEINDLGYECDMTCIFVDNSEHLYLTNDYIVTHNTMVTVATAMLMYEEGIIDGIVYMSAAGVYEHKQGLLPGTLEQKSLILQTPLRQALVDLGYDPDRVISSDSSMMAQKDGTACIIAQTDSYIRGINIGSKDHKVMLIVDEAQNFTRSALRTVLTRVGDGSFAVVIGQARQCDLKYPQDSGFIPAIELFRSEPWCKICTLTESYRSRISQKADEL